MKQLYHPSIPAQMLHGDSCGEPYPPDSHVENPNQFQAFHLDVSQLYSPFHMHSHNIYDVQPLPDHLEALQKNPSNGVDPDNATYNLH